MRCLSYVPSVRQSSLKQPEQSGTWGGQHESSVPGTGGDPGLPEIGGGRDDITVGERKVSGTGGPRELPFRCEIDERSEY